MSEVKVIPVQPKPEFDLMYFMEVCGETRMKHDLMERLEDAWMDWKDRLHAVKLVPSTSSNDDGFLLIWLTEGVEEAVEDAWGESQEAGSYMHNLAITLVMSSAQSLIPELLEGCTPLPKPGKEVQDFLESRGLEWNANIGALNRQYAIYTPMPYQGGCEVCMQSSVCPNSTLRDN